jgi:hypothetical protein
MKILDGDDHYTISDIGLDNDEIKSDIVEEDTNLEET